DVPLETFERNFRKIVVKAGLEGCTFKNIRNTAITDYFDASANVSEVVSISGHKKAETALNIYRKNTKKQAYNGYVKKVNTQQKQLPLNQVQLNYIMEQVMKALAKRTETQ
ncbi:MAG: tyrosine-type recombinase/integrase, partial [Alphaproteobacteria bacterium]|nr:tyrosine-type recombinase/integrase [Alphaproteobacteria bacterium]